jgi:hypothetical protein
MMLCRLAGGLTVPLMAADITLSWRHSVEHTVWQEDWHADRAGLRLVAARIEGSGAGMEPPPDAVLKNGFWTWTPLLPPLPKVVLRRSGATADWQVCRDKTCVAMDTLVPKDADPVVLTTCDAPTGR